MDIILPIAEVLLWDGKALDEAEKSRVHRTNSVQCTCLIDHDDKGLMF